MAHQRRASGMCNRLHMRKMKVATWEAVLTLIDCLRQDNLPVQPVARRAGTKPSRERLLAAHPRTSFEGTRGVSLETEIRDSILRRRWHKARTQHRSYE
jgi:hypothetical protein